MVTVNATHIVERDWTVYNDPEAFRVIQTCLGMCGIVTKVVLRVGKNITLQEYIVIIF